MSLVRNKKSFYRGLVMLLAFAVLFWAMLQPFFRSNDGKPMTALQWTDGVFNRLSKGSSWFVPEIKAAISNAGDLPVSVALAMPDAKLAQACLGLLAASGITAASYENQVLSFTGNLATLLTAAANDGGDLYHNEGGKICDCYGVENPLLVSSAWWHLLNPCIKALQKQNKPGVAALVEQVVKKAIEPGNNFYGLRVARVADNILLVCGLLAFYVFYAVWYGFAVYNLFAGLGLLGMAQAEENVEESEI